MDSLQPWSLRFDLSTVASVPLPSLPDVVREAYRRNFEKAVFEGRAYPLLVPWMLFPLIIVPSVWLSIPHTSRPWLYHTRWIVMGFILGANVFQVLYVSSTSFAGMYASGLAATWSTFLGMNLFVFKRPQFEAARILRVKKSPSTTANGRANGNGYANGSVHSQELRQRKQPLANGTAGFKSPEDDAYEYIWQPYPADESFAQRFGWSLDLLISFRGSGWNWSISTVPRAAGGKGVKAGELVDMNSVPLITRQGYKISKTIGEFMRNRLQKTVAAYLLLDFLSVLMMKDPYFMLGPGYENPLPPHLAGWPDPALHAYRQLASVSGVFGAILYMFSISDMVQFWFLEAFYPSCGGLHRFATIYGSMGEILDRGLPGYWGGWWHQSFRQQFLSPTSYFVKKGYLKEGSAFTSITSAIIVFSLSGILHASGSITALRYTNPMRPIIFFILQCVGVIAQDFGAKLARPYTKSMPVFARKLGNAAFTLWWLYQTAEYMCDDFASVGIWMFDPVPISPLRWLGFGQPGDHWWRWDEYSYARVYVGKTWLQTGLAL